MDELPASGDVTGMTGIFPFPHRSELHKAHISQSHITEKAHIPCDRAGAVGEELKGDFLSQYLIQSPAVEIEIFTGIFFDILHKSIGSNDVVLLLNGEFGAAARFVLFQLFSVGKKAQIIDPDR